MSFLFGPGLPLDLGDFCGEVEPSDISAPTTAPSPSAVDKISKGTASPFSVTTTSSFFFFLLVFGVELPLFFFLPLGVKRDSAVGMSSRLITSPVVGSKKPSSPVRVEKEVTLGLLRRTGLFNQTRYFQMWKGPHDPCHTTIHYVKNPGFNTPEIDGRTGTK